MVAVTPVNLAYNTVYLVDCDSHRVLIDTGPDYDGAKNVLTSSLGSRLPGLVVATHGHSDHAGLGRWWQTRGVSVAIGAADSGLVRGLHFTHPGEFESFTAYVADSGAPPSLQASLIRGLGARRELVRRAAAATYPAARPTDRWPSGLRFEPFEPDRLLEDDAPLTTELRALSCPGHTPGNVVVVAEEDGLLFSGDQLLPDITPTPGIQFVPGRDGAWTRFPSLPPFVASLKRLQGLGLARCYPGHGEPFDNVPDVIARNLAQVEQRTDRVLTELWAAGESNTHDLAERLYPRALRRRWWQIIATIQGHLDLLAGRQRARCDEGVWRPLP